MAGDGGLFADPPGDPDGVEDAADRFAALARDLDQLAAALRRQLLGRQAWCGLTADGVRVSAQGAAAAVAREAQAMAPTAPALRSWASDLREGRSAMRQLRRRHEQELLDHGRRMRRLEEQARAQAAAEAVAAVAVGAGGAPRPLPGPAPGPDPIVLELARHAQAVRELRREGDRVLDRLDDAALSCRRRLEDTCPGYVRGHRESVDDYLRGVAVDLLDEIPVLKRHTDTLESSLWAFMTAPQAYLVGTQVVRRGSALLKYLRFGEPLHASRFTLLQRQLLTRLGLTSWLDPASLLGKAWLGTARSSNLLSVFSGAARGQGARGLLAGTRAAASAGGAARFLGVAGAGAATAYSAVNVASQGNPVEAWRANGASYGADVAELGFNASLTTFMVAPNPYSAVAMGVTGMAWAGFEVYSHRDDIARVARQTLPMVKDTLDAAGDAAADAVDDAVAGAKKVGSALNPFD